MSLLPIKNVPLSYPQIHNIQNLDTPNCHPSNWSRFHSSLKQNHVYLEAWPRHVVVWTGSYFEMIRLDFNIYFNSSWMQWQILGRNFKIQKLGVTQPMKWIIATNFRKKQVILSVLISSIFLEQVFRNSLNWDNA